MTTWPLPQSSTMTEHERALSSFSCLYIVTRTHTVAQVMSLSSHPHVHVHVSVSPRLALPFYFTQFLTHSFSFLLHLKFVDYNLLLTPHNRLWAQRLRLQGDLSRALHGAPGLAAALLRQSLFCGRRLRWRCTRGYALRSSLSTYPVKSTSPVTENHYKNGYVKLYNNKNFIMTNVDNNRDTKYTINNDTNNHNAHNLHKWAQ